jgi:PhnB protein
MTIRLNPYLSFRDNAREAMEFYRSVFGGELTTSTFADFHASEDPSEQDKIMHSELVTGGGMTLMGSDTPNSMEYSENGYAISLSGAAADEADLRDWWSKLSESGSVTLPLERAPWGDEFGMCVDKYGVSWMVSIAGS